MGRVTVTRPRWWTIVAVAVASGLMLFAAACGPGGGTPSGGETSASASPSTPTTLPAAALCRDAAALRASLSKLTHVTVGMGAAAEISADLAEVKAKLDTFTADAGTQWQAQTTAMKAALAKLSAAAKNLASQPGAATLEAVVNAIGGVTTAAQNLLGAVNAACPAVSAIPSM